MQPSACRANIAGVAIRTAQDTPPGLRFQRGERWVQAPLLAADGERLFLRLSDPPEVGAKLEARWSGPERLQFDVKVASVGSPAPDGRQPVALTLERLTGFDGAEKLTHAMTTWLGMTPPLPPPTQSGHAWWVQLAEPPEPAADAPQELRGPGVRVAGQRHDQAAAPPLMTGLEATTVESLRAYFEGSGQRTGAYLNVPCAYTVAGAQYWGRALRLNDRAVQVNTGAVVPGLGVRIRCDLTLELDGVRRPVSLYGIMSQKKDPPGSSTYKASLMIRYSHISEGESPGLLVAFLQAQAQKKQAG